MSLRDAIVLRARRITSHPAVNRGRRHECPVCGSGLRRFVPHKRRPGARCPVCGSLERHRVLWLYLRDEVGIERFGGRLLHFAPERALASRLRALPGVEYVSGDLSPGAADEVMDITAIPRPDASFDLVLCNHVLEHVPDDGAAMRELRRVLAPGSRLIMQHPVVFSSDATYEDPTVVTPEDREREFLQHDHVRLYGRDYLDRLAAAGLAVELVRYRQALPEDVRRRHALDPAGDAGPDGGDEIADCTPA